MYKAHAEPAIQFPIGSRCRFCRGSDPNTIKTSISFASLDLHSSAPPYHHTPWGPSSWQSDRPTLTVSSGYGGRSTRRASTACFTVMAPSCHSPQGFQAWAWPANPTDSFLAYALYGQGDRRSVCVCACACACVCVCAGVHSCAFAQSQHVSLFTTASTVEPLYKGDTAETQLAVLCREVSLIQR